MTAPSNEGRGDQRTSPKSALDKYIEYIRCHRSLRTFRTYRPILNHIGEFCSRKYIEDVQREDLIDFATHCLKQSLKGKNVYNKLVVISQVLKQYGRGRLLNAADWPSFVEKIRPIYETSEVQSLLVAHTPDEKIRFQFYLVTGFRDAEGRFVTWQDVNFRNCAVHVTAKPKWGFQPKNWEEREVPVSAVLMSVLRKHKPENATAGDPVFPSASGRPDGAMLEKLKAIAHRAKLNCRHRNITRMLADGKMKTNRCSEGPYCGRWFLHKFRHTYATRHLQDGVDIRTVQQ